jgi:dipeptidyl aminopeptidase/acylaminoacyl peptidase
LFDRSIRDRYGDPGSPVTRPDETGFPFVVCADESIWLAGSGASPDGDLPFFDRMDLTTRATTRLWRCEPGHYERVSGCFTGADGRPQKFVTSHESPTEPPNYRARDMDGRLTAELTDFPDPMPQIRGIQKQLVTYKRADGVPLSATMYLPADWKPGQRLPLFIWAYPLEFSDASTAGQVSGSPHTFTEINGISHLALVLAGYAVMDNATMPVIGEPETANDTFVEQISGAAEAAINHAVEMGVADRDRVAVGGHSYGAFMTANLLAHTKLFKAGIARSGAYNRTLTPFGFQAERRPYWEAREVYEKVSPFTWANQIQTPLLLIHGEADNNSGTFPIQSERLYQAVKGNGGTVRLVTLPHESHGYRARESVLHTQAEMLNWLNRFMGEAKADSN